MPLHVLHEGKVIELEPPAEEIRNVYYESSIARTSYVYLLRNKLSRTFRDMKVSWTEIVMSPSNLGEVFELKDVYLKTSHTSSDDPNVFNFMEAVNSKDPSEILSAPLPLEENLSDLFPNEIKTPNDPNIRRRGDWSTHYQTVHYCHQGCSAYGEFVTPPLECPKCGTPTRQSKSFIISSLREKVREWYSIPSIAHTLKSRTKRARDPHNICDFFDSDVFMKLRQTKINNPSFSANYKEKIDRKYFQDENELAIAINITTARIYENELSVIVSAVCLNLPYEERYRNGNVHIISILPSFSALKFDWNTALIPLIEDFAEASTVGYTVYDSTIKKNVTVRTHVVGVSSDFNTSQNVVGIGLRRSFFECRDCPIKTLMFPSPSHHGVTLFNYVGIPCHYPPYGDRFTTFPRSTKFVFGTTRSNYGTGKSETFDEFCMGNGFMTPLKFFTLGSCSIENIHLPNPSHFMKFNVFQIFLFLFGITNISSFRLNSTERSKLLSIMENANQLTFRNKINRVTFDIEDLIEKSKAYIEPDRRYDMGEDQCFTFLDIIFAVYQFSGIPSVNKRFISEEALLYKVAFMEKYPRALINDFDKSVPELFKLFEKYIVKNDYHHLPELSIFLHSLIHLPKAIINYGNFDFSYSKAFDAINEYLMSMPDILDFNTLQLAESLGQIGAKYRWAESVKFDDQFEYVYLKLYLASSKYRLLKEKTPNFDFPTHSMRYYKTIRFLTLEATASFDDCLRFVEEPVENSSPSQFGYAQAFITINSNESSTLPGPSKSFVIIKKLVPGVVKPIRVQLKSLKISNASQNTVTAGHYTNVNLTHTKDSSLFEPQYVVVPLSQVIAPVFFLHDNTKFWFGLDLSFVMEYKDKNGKNVRLEKFTMGDEFDSNKKLYQQDDEGLPLSTSIAKRYHSKKINKIYVDYGPFSY
ncbi:uncharacterized protein SAPINGB_P004430 [Magnusiomyces paraingens]|uniref:Uncharacterized protein n=1 Tax=Magnusiomyces paraingens TaxID=2606893 RepID=A0A5E8BUG1_9ASCO|nr:uncharacterized protein SAPINGB_P004430 [Saprochaete ingens]VVT55106.1 unnamed protein product [Saprochaete ingens]